MVAIVIQGSAVVEVLAGQRPALRAVPRPDGIAAGYADAADLCQRMGVADYLEDKEPYGGDLYERAVVAAEESWQLQDGTRHEALGSEWLAGYRAGVRSFRADLIAYEDDEAAEKRVRAAGVSL